MGWSLNEMLKCLEGMWNIGLAQQHRQRLCQLWTPGCWLYRESTRTCLSDQLICTIIPPETKPWIRKVVHTRAKGSVHQKGFYLGIFGTISILNRVVGGSRQTISCPTFGFNLQFIPRLSASCLVKRPRSVLFSNFLACQAGPTGALAGAVREGKDTTACRREVSLFFKTLALVSRSSAGNQLQSIFYSVLFCMTWGRLQTSWLHGFLILSVVSERRCEQIWTLFWLRLWKFTYLCLQYK